MKNIKSKYLMNQYDVYWIFKTTKDSYSEFEKLLKSNPIFFSKVSEGLEIDYVPLYKYAELKSNLATENEGSSKKVIDDLLNKKRKPIDNNEQMIINLNAVYNYLNSTKPQITLKAIKTIYSILETNIDMYINELDAFPRKYSGEVHGYKTPNPSKLSKALENLISFIDSQELNDNPLEKAHAIHIYWIYYHFTYDFNGRMGRILAYWYFLLNDDKTWLFVAQSISSSIALFRKKYIKLWDEIRKKKDDVQLISILHSFVQIINLNYSLITLKISIFLFNTISSNAPIILNDTQTNILINLTCYNKWVSLEQINQLIDLGFSKAGIHKTVEQLVDLNLMLKKRQGRNNFYIPNYQKMNINDEDLRTNDIFWEEIIKSIW